MESLAPPLGEVSWLDNADSVISSGLFHVPNLPDGISSEVVLYSIQDSSIIFIIWINCAPPSIVIILATYNCYTDFWITKSIVDSVSKNSKKNGSLKNKHFKSSQKLQKDGIGILENFIENTRDIILKG